MVNLNPFRGSSSPSVVAQVVQFDPPDSAPPANVVPPNLLAAELSQLDADNIIIDTQRAYFDNTYMPLIDWELFREVFPGYFPDTSSPTRDILANLSGTHIGFKDNWMQTIIDAVSDRMEIDGIGTDPRSTTDPTALNAYQTVWDALLLNNIKEDIRSVVDSMQVDSRVGIFVWPDESHPAKIRVDWQPAGLYRVRYSSEYRRKINWMVKRWLSDEGDIWVTIYTPQYVYKYIESSSDNQLNIRAQVSSANALSEVVKEQTVGTLTRRTVPGESWPLPNPFAPEVPGTEINNVGYKYELDKHIPQQNAFDQSIFDLMIATRFAASRQRHVSAIGDAPEEGWEFGPHKVWMMKPSYDPEGRPVMPQFGSFEASDPGLIIKVTEMWLMHIANTARTPGRYFHTVDRGGRGDAPSGDSMLIDEQPLLNKTRAKVHPTNSGFRRICQLVARHLNLPADPFKLVDMQWRDPRFNFRSAVLDDAIKKVGDPATGKGLGLPVKWAIRDLGLTHAEILELERMMEEQKQEAREDAEMQAEQEIRVAKETAPPPAAASPAPNSPPR